MNKYRVFPPVIGLTGIAGAGKSQICYFIQNYLASRGIGYSYITIGQSVKEIARRDFGWNGKKDEAGRDLLQQIAETGRAYDEDIWIKKWFDRVRNMKPDDTGFILVDDIRYHNDHAFIKDVFLGARTYRVEGRGSLKGDQALHSTETDIPNINVDSVINNDSSVTLKDLEMKVTEELNSLVVS